MQTLARVWYWVIVLAMGAAATWLLITAAGVRTAS